MTKGTEVLSPNLGLYLDRTLITIPLRGLSSGLNFRIRDGKINNLNLGWEPFDPAAAGGQLTVGSVTPVLLIDQFFPTSQGLPEQLIFGTATDLFEYRSATHDLRYITPIYAVGTVAVAGTAVTGTGTSWANATLNIHAGDEIHFGNANQRDPAAVWFTLAAVPGSNTTITLTSSAGTIGAGTAYTIRRKFSGGATTQWSTEKFIRDTGNDDWWYATNGVDPVVRWDGVTDQVVGEFEGFVLPWRARYLFVYNNMMIYLNLTESGTLKPTDMANSIPGDPAVVNTGLGSQFKVHAGSDEIVGAEQLGDNLVIYSTQHIVLVQFVGDPLVFIFRQASDGVGPFGQHAIASFGDYHEFVGRDSLYVFDGVRVVESNTHVWREILRTQDPVRIARAYHHWDEENGELMWIVPLTTDPSPGVNTSPPAISYVEHYLEPVGDKTPRPYSNRSFPFTTTGFYSKQVGITWAELSQTWAQVNFRWNDKFFFTAFPLNLAGDSTGKIWIFNSVQNANGAALPSFVRFGRRATAEGRRRGLVKRVYPFVDQFANNLEVTVLLSDHLQGPSTISDEQVFNQSLVEGGNFTTHYRRGRYFEVQFGTDGPSQPYQLGGYDVKTAVGGGER